MLTKRLNLPDTASVANSVTNDRLSAPSAVRNAQAIRDVLRGYLPVSGNALEIASGTGEHILGLGHEHPHIVWQPTDIDDERLESIAAWQQSEGTKNVLPPKYLDAGTCAWPEEFSRQNLILLVNLLHLISDNEARNVIVETAKALVPGGYAAIYGPFKRGENFASDGDEIFHKSLNTQDAKIGYKSFEQIQIWQSDTGLTPLTPVEMPANNLMLIAQKPVDM